MYNTGTYGVGMPRRVVYQQPVIIANPYTMPINNNYQQPYQQSHISARNNRPGQEEPINAVDGILIIHDYQPGKGDPLVVEQAKYRGEVVRVGDKKKEIVKDQEAILIGQGYASQNGKYWKHIPKITMNVFKVGQLQIKNITKVKARYQTTLPHHKIMKITCKEQNYFLAFKQSQFNQWFLRLVWAKLILEKRDCSDFGQWERQIVGKLYKKSFVMGEWEPRVVTIDHRGLRASKDNSSSINLQIKQTKEIWTRFEQIQGGYYLVVKLWNGIIKEEFAVPTSFCLNWLIHFLGMLVLK